MRRASSKHRKSRFNKAHLLLLILTSFFLNSCKKDASSSARGNSSSSDSTQGQPEPNNEAKDSGTTIPPAANPPKSSGVASPSPPSGPQSPVPSGGSVRPSNWTFRQVDETMFGSKLRQGNYKERCESIATDSQGNIYCAGGALAPNDAGGDEERQFGYVAKISRSGELLWHYRIGGNDPSPKVLEGGRFTEVKGVTVDSHGNVLIAGGTTNSFGETHSRAHLNETGRRPSDSFILKLDPTGRTLWVTQLGAVTRATTTGNTWDDWCLSVAVDREGSAYCAGFTMGPLGAGQKDGYGADGFVMKVDQSGKLKWLRHFGAKSSIRDLGYEELFAIAVDNLGHVYAVGSRRLSNKDADHGLWVKLRALDGAVVASKEFANAKVQGRHYSVDLRDIEFVAPSSLVISGRSNGSFHGPSRMYDGIVAKLDLNGNLVWKTQLNDDILSKAATGERYSNDGNDGCGGLTVDTSGYIYCGGYTTGNFADQIIQMAPNYSDALVVKLSPQGELLWAKQTGSSWETFPGASTAGSEICNELALSGDRLICGGNIFGSKLYPQAAIPGSGSLFLWSTPKDSAENK